MGFFNPKHEVMLLNIPSKNELLEKNGVEEPRTVNEALESDAWRKVMNSEMEVLHKNEMWRLVPYSNSYNIVGNKSVFKKHFVLLNLL